MQSASKRKGSAGKMKVCVPVAEYRGLDSPVYGHFGSAPEFALIETESMLVEPLSNADHDHVHGACSPVRALAGARPDAVIVGGMGAGALRGLRALKVRVYHSNSGTVGEAIARLKSGELAEMDEQAACGHHGSGRGCH